MDQIERTRQERIALQRQADNDNAYFSQNELIQRSSRQEKIVLQRQADSEEVQDAQEKKSEEESQRDQRKLTAFRILDLRRKHISEAEYELNEEKRTKPTLLKYSPAFILSILKDLLDLAGFSLPGISFIITTCFGIAIFVALYLAKTNRSLFEMKRIATFIVGYLIEAFGFGPNLLPIQTLTVALIFILDRIASNELIARAIQVLDNIKKN
jgi:hypothetical protein